MCKSSHKRKRHYADLVRIYHLTKTIKEELEYLITTSFLISQIKMAKQSNRQSEMVSQVAKFNAKWHKQ